MSVEELQLKFQQHKIVKPVVKPVNFDFTSTLMDSIPLNADSRPCVLYMRISTQYQKNDGHSLDHQDSILTDYCKKNNLYIIEKFVEVISGGTMDRPELQRMLNSLKPGYCVVCNAVSRLSRNMDDLSEINKRIKKSKASLILLDISIDTSTPNGKMLLNMVGSVAEIERAQISERVSNVMQYLKSENKLKTKPHYGWRRTVNGLEKKEDEQAVIDMIKWIIKNDPDVSLCKICVQLNNRGFTNRNSKKFHTGTISSILKHNNIYCKCNLNPEENKQNLTTEKLNQNTQNLYQNNPPSQPEQIIFPYIKENLYPNHYNTQSQYAINTYPNNQYNIYPNNTLPPPIIVNTHMQQNLDSNNILPPPITANVDSQQNIYNIQPHQNVYSNNRQYQLPPPYSNISQIDQSHQPYQNIYPNNYTYPNPSNNHSL